MSLTRTITKFNLFDNIHGNTISEEQEEEYYIDIDVEKENQKEEKRRRVFGRDSVRIMNDYEYEEYLDAIDIAVEDLLKNGYAVIPALFNKNECDEFRELVQYCLDDLGLTKDLDYKKAKVKDLPPHIHGIMQGYRMNHLKPFRDLRKHPKVLGVHARLNGSACLVSSLDRVNIKFPGRSYQSRDDGWAHVDQNPRNLGLRYIQSYVTFTEGTLESPQNRFYKGSHLIFDKFFKHRRTSSKADTWIRLTNEEKKSLVEKYGCELVKPTCPPGSMILWDSRTVHDPDEGTDFSDGRLVVYLCYSKACNEMKGKNGKSTFCEKKQKAFSDCRSTPHSPFPQTLFPKQLRTYGRDKGPFDEIPVSMLGNPKEDVTKDGRIKPDTWEELLFCFKDYPTVFDNHGAVKINPLAKEWFGYYYDDLVFGSRYIELKYTPFSVPLITYKKEKESNKNKKDGIAINDDDDDDDDDNDKKAIKRKMIDLTQGEESDNISLKKRKQTL